MTISSPESCTTSFPWSLAAASARGFFGTWLSSMESKRNGAILRLSSQAVPSWMQRPTSKTDSRQTARSTNRRASLPNSSRSFRAACSREPPSTSILSNIHSSQNGMRRRYSCERIRTQLSSSHSDVQRPVPRGSPCFGGGVACGSDVLVPRWRTPVGRCNPIHAHRNPCRPLLAAAQSLRWTSISGQDGIRYLLAGRQNACRATSSLKQIADLGRDAIIGPVF